MGGTATLVCTIAAYHSSLTYYSPNGTYNTLSNTTDAIVNGGSCAWTINAGDAGDYAEFFNTTDGQNVLEAANCTVKADGTCTTPYFTWNAAAYKLETFTFAEIFPATQTVNESHVLNIYALPPVPQQTPLFNFVNGGTVMNATTSRYSSQYGYPLIGCVAAAGRSPYYGQDLPAQLYSNPAANNLPYTTNVTYNVQENQAINLPLVSLHLLPSTSYDVHWFCYNGYGRSPATSIYNVITPSTLPQPGPQSSSQAPFVFVSSSASGARASSSAAAASSSAAANVASSSTGSPAGVPSSVPAVYATSSSTPSSNPGGNAAASTSSVSSFLVGAVALAATAALLA